MKLNLILTAVGALALGYAGFTLIAGAIHSDRDFGARLNQQRLFMQVALALNTPNGCSKILGERIRTWDHQTRTSLEWANPNVRLQLVAGPSVEVQSGELRREIPLVLPSCQLDADRARFETATYVTANGGTPPAWAGFVRRCRFNQFLTRQPDPYSFTCLDFPP